VKRYGATNTNQLLVSTYGALSRQRMSTRRPPQRPRGRPIRTGWFQMATHGSSCNNTECFRAVDHDLLFVAGLSGAGKSTFIELLQTGRLPPEITERLPKGCEHWPVASSNDYRTGSTAPPMSKIVLHYSIVYPLRHGIHEYQHDPVLRRVELIDSLTVVSIQLSHEQLNKQFATRLQYQLSQKSAFRRFWQGRVHLPMQRARSLLKLSNSRNKEGDLYSDPRWVSWCCEKWEDYLRLILRDKPSARVIQITPCRDEGYRPMFRLGSTPGSNVG